MEVSRYKLVMNLFLPEEFFDLKTFAHRAIFNLKEPVWNVLRIIKDYLRSRPLGEIQVTIPDGVHLVNPEWISIGKGSIVEAGAYIVGPCMIGENCQIRSGAYLRGDVIAGNHCVIGHVTEVKNSLLLDGAQAAHFAYVGDSILGNQVNLGAGTKCANLRFDHANIKISFEHSIFDSGLRKFGAILGDHVQTGCNSVTNPGTLIGVGSYVGPCCNVGGVIPKQSFIKAINNNHNKVNTPSTR